MPTEPETVAPERTYLGITCDNCHLTFAVAGPVDPAVAPPDKPLQVRAQSPILHTTCTNCGHKADYPLERLHRFTRA
jgi:hypothetical protein